MSLPDKIHIFGASGSGVITLAAAIAEGGAMRAHHTISRNCFGRRDISAGCCVISANGLMLNTKPSGVHSAHSLALRRWQGDLVCRR